MKDLKMPNVNTVIIAGNCTRDVELRTAGSSKVANIGIASSKYFRRAGSSDWEQDTTFITVVAWNALAELCAEKLRKGSPVLVEGNLQSRSWETDGQKRNVIEIRASRIQFLEREGVVVLGNSGPLDPDELPF